MRFLIIICLPILLFSCKKKQEESVQTNDVFAQKTALKKISTSSEIIELHSESKKFVENWQEYQAIAEFMPKFYKTSTKEILLNSNQLATLTTYLKDSIRIKKLDTPSFKIRLNVLHSEAMRLFDMDSIPSITDKEVLHENKNIIEAFNAVNMKINSIVKKNVLINDLSEFDYLFKENNSKTTNKKIVNEENFNIDFEDEIFIDKNKTTAKKREIEKRKAISKRIQPLSTKKTINSENN